VLYSDSGSINCSANVSAYPTAIWAGNGSINVVTVCAATGQIIGEEWSDLVPDATNWTGVTTGEDTWTAVVAGSGEWTPVTEVPNTWTTQSSGSNTWTRQ
jgi:hypothetical protein